MTLLERLKQSRKAAQSGSVLRLTKDDLKKGLLQSPKVQYTWYQTPTRVGIEIPYVIEKKDHLETAFEKQHIKVGFPLREGERFQIEFQLFDLIVPEASKAFHRLDRIQIILEKATQSLSWLSLSKNRGLSLEAQEKQQVTYPSSAKSKKNWDKINQEIQGDILANAEQYGQDPAMSFFKQIFANGDPEKRKAMIKSFQTSKGTVLSTDWSDVSKKDFEGKDMPAPPDGTEWKKSQ